MIYIFLIELIILIYVLLMINKKDILTPASGVCYVFLLSTVCVIYNQKYWDYKLSFKAFIILSIGILIFVFVSVLVVNSFDKLILVKKNQEVIHYIYIESWKSRLVIIYDLAFLMLYFKNVLKIIRAYTSSSNWYLMMQKYRQVTSYGILNSNESIPLFSEYTYRLIEVFGYLYLYILINNFFADKDEMPYVKKKSIHYYPVIIYMISGILTSGRMYILQFASAAIVIFYIIWHRKYGWRKFVGYKFILRTVYVVLGVLLIFILTRGLVGRGIEFNPIYYIALYGGQSIPNFDLFLQNPPASSNIWGKETFSGIINFIGKVTGNSKLRYISHKEFRYINGIFLGNVYTAFREYIYDFGYLGLIILTILASLFYSVFYICCKSSSKNTRIDYRLIIFSYFSFGIFYYCIDDRLFGQLLTIGTLIWIVLLYFAGSFLNIKLKNY